MWAVRKITWVVSKIGSRLVTLISVGDKPVVCNLVNRHDYICCDNNFVGIETLRGSFHCPFVRKSICAHVGMCSELAQVFSRISWPYKFHFQAENSHLMLLKVGRKCIGLCTCSTEKKFPVSYKVHYCEYIFSYLIQFRIRPKGLAWSFWDIQPYGIDILSYSVSHDGAWTHQSSESRLPIGGKILYVARCIMNVV